MNLHFRTLTGSAGTSATGNALANVLQGNGAANVLNGGWGDDTLLGGAGDDTLIGAGGRDRLDGGAGADRMQGGAGDDFYFVDIGDAVIEAAGGGRDEVSSRLSYTLGANVENLTLTGFGATSGIGNALANVITGNNAANTLDGGAGNDVLNGGRGADGLIGGVGRDLLTGGAGPDAFVYRSAAEAGLGAGRDVLVDFGAGDRIDLGAIDARAGIAGNQAFSFIGSQAFSGRGGELSHRGGIIRGDTNGDGLADLELRLPNGTILDASDFIL